MKNKYVLYYVEGKDEEKIINTLKSEMMKIIPGKVQVFNVVERIITDARLMSLRPNTTIVLVFDTDTGKLEVLEGNIKKLEKCSCVSNVIIIPQVKNLEDELVRSCDIKNIKNLLGSKSKSEFKSDLIKSSNLADKLQQCNFDIKKFWSSNPTSPYQNLKNSSQKVKVQKS